MITFEDVQDISGDYARVYPHGVSVIVDAYEEGEREATFSFSFTAEQALELARVLIEAAEGEK